MTETPTTPLTEIEQVCLRACCYHPTLVGASVACRGLFGHGMMSEDLAPTPAGRAHVENVIGRLVPLTSDEILSIVEALTRTFGFSTAGIEGALRDRLAALLTRKEPTDG